MSNRIQINKINLKNNKQNMENNNRIEIKYIYDAKELSTEIINVVEKSLRRILDKRYNYLRRVEFKYSDDNVFTSEYYYQSNYRYNNSNDTSLTYLGLTHDKYSNILAKMSKNDKKKINRMIIKISKHLSNSYRLIKMLNYIESKSGKRNHFSIENSKEDEISRKREIYKTLLEYSKIDIQTELKKAKEEFKKTKGDFYKSNTLEINKVSAIKIPKFNLLSFFKNLI